MWYATSFAVHRALCCGFKKSEMARRAASGRSLKRFVNTFCLHIRLILTLYCHFSLLSLFHSFYGDRYAARRKVLCRLPRPFCLRTAHFHFVLVPSHSFNSLPGKLNHRLALPCVHAKEAAYQIARENNARFLSLLNLPAANSVNRPKALKPSYQCVCLPYSYIP